MTRHLPTCTIAFVAALTLVGCATPYVMMPTPMLHTGKQTKPLFTDVSADRRTPSLDLFYISA